MEFEELVYKRRTIRRFLQKEIDTEILRKLVDYARVAPMGMNIQALDFVIVKNEKKRREIFKHIRFAGALPEHLRTPPENQRPMAYIVVILNTDLKNEAPHDVGTAMENIALGATNYGLGACMMGAIDADEIHKILDLPSNYRVQTIVSLGYPAEQSQMEPFKGDFKYWKDENGNMHVPKRDLDDVIFKIYE